MATMHCHTENKSEACNELQEHTKTMVNGRDDTSDYVNAI